jgi:hypothetical protein
MFPLLQELERPKLRNIFSINKTEIQLTLTDNYIVLSDHLNFRSPTHFTRLVFDLKFEVIYHPAQVALLIFRCKNNSEPPLPSNSRERDVKNNLPSPLATPPLSSCGPSSSKNESINATFTNFSRQKRRLAKELSPPSIWQKD